MADESAGRKADPSGTQARRRLIAIGTAATVALASWNHGFFADRGWG